ncbi:cytochrome P450 [Mollisia scopiformis]|uniref:Cytochrome P450 n=1 Tax=Mollisia scopiformis TaxID=149040 RepID=A0A194WWP0_MOLSC|nr:cytochrome P450 [Mollisia scopiformis]KUJ12388.1 cytochrome P450 [Mollisia scopiformis]
METTFVSVLQQHSVISAGCFILLFYVARTIYSVYFGPLAKFPGSKLAAATLWYEFYYDVILMGCYTFKIQEWHKEYGPIIRISPYELHIDEPEYYEELYSHHKPRDKYPFYVNQFELPGSTFGTVSHRLHRRRRAALNPFFSKQQINRLQPMLTHMISKLCSRIDEFEESGQPMGMRPVYMCLTTDIVTLYALNQSWGYLDSEDFAPLWVETIKAVTVAGAVIKQFPWVLPLMRILPRGVVRVMDPGMIMLLEWQEKIQANTQAVIDGRYKTTQEGTELGLDKTIFHALLESDLPPEDKLHSRLWQEGQVVVGAGADTTANALTVTHFHILDNPDVQKRLRDELVAALPDKSASVELRVVEQLPYLNAVIQEGFRLSYGVSTRLQRIHPKESMRFQDYEIPAGTPVGMTSVLMHTNPTIFPDPHVFRPERWLEKRPEGAPPLDRYLVNFSKGSRQCVGINLAKAEMYLTLATVFRRYEGQKLFETTRRDVDLKHDLFLPSAELDSKGVRVVFS